MRRAKVVKVVGWLLPLLLVALTAVIGAGCGETVQPPPAPPVNVTAPLTPTPPTSPVNVTAPLTPTPPPAPPPQAEIDVTGYGAVGNGVTDDTDAIQAAIDACSAGGTVYVPDGIYMIRHDVHTVYGPYYGGCFHYGLEATAGMKLRLESNAILRMIPNSGDIGGVLGIVDIDGVEICGGTIEGDRPNHTGNSEFSHGIVVVSASNLLIHDITLQHCQGDGMYSAALHADGVGPFNTDITIDNIIARLNFRHGMATSCLVGAVISNSTFNGNTGEGQSMGIDMEAEGGQEITGVTLSNNVFFDNEAHGLAISGVGTLDSDITVAGNESYGNGVYGFVVEPLADTGQASNITFDTNNAHDNGPGIGTGFLLKHADSCLLENSQARNNSSFGFVFQDFTHSRVSYNTSADNTLGNYYWNDACAGTTCDHNTGISDR